MTIEQQRIISLPGPAGPPPDGPTSSIDALLYGLAAAAARGAAGAELDPLDVELAVDATTARTAAGLDAGEAAELTANQGRAAAQGAGLQAEDFALAFPDSVRRPVDWSGFGALLPVLSGSPGAGASVVAAALTDALQLAGRCVLLIDAAEPVRSGLAAAAAEEGPWFSAVNEAVTIRYSWREHALLARLETPLPVVTPSMVPPPPEWLPELDPLHVTVVDIGYDGWRATQNPLVGAGGWLRRGRPSARPLLVVRATRPSLRQAEQVLARLDPWVAGGVAIHPVQLVVCGAKRWPAGVTGAAGRRLASLIDDAVFVPHNPDLEVGGITADLLPDKVIAAVTGLLQDWQLVPAVRSRRGRAR